MVHLQHFNISYCKVKRLSLLQMITWINGPLANDHWDGRPFANDHLDTRPFANDHTDELASCK